jgi:hypothetical protein
MALFLGKLPPKFNRKTLTIHGYLPPGILPPPLEHRAWEYKISDADWALSMLGNDVARDCVIAAILHFIMSATARTNQAATFTTQDAFDLYAAITGWDGVPGSPSDQGTAMTDAMAYMVKTGVKDQQGRLHKWLGWASIKLDLASLRQAIAIFGGILVGTAITQSMMDQFNAGQPWNAPFSGDVLGGHGIPWLGYGREGQTCITWAKRWQMDLNAPEEMDEAYAPITADFLNAQGVSPSGFDLAALQADLKALAA